MDDNDLNHLLYREQHALLLARMAGSQAARARHSEIDRIFGRRICALRYPYRSFANGRWSPYDPAPLNLA
jgi:hypothetical protein